jgi:hypothetical protein
VVCGVPADLDLERFVGAALVRLCLGPDDAAAFMSRPTAACAEPLRGDS